MVAATAAKKKTSPPLIDDIEDEEERELTQIVSNEVWENPKADARKIVKSIKALGWSPGGASSVNLDEIHDAIDDLTDHLDRADAQISINTDYNNNSAIRDRELRKALENLSDSVEILKTQHITLKNNVMTDVGRLASRMGELESEVLNADKAKKAKNTATLSAANPVAKLAAGGIVTPKISADPKTGEVDEQKKKARSFRSWFAVWAAPLDK